MINLPPKRNESLVHAYILEERLSGCELYNHLEGDSWDKQLKAWGYPSHESLDVEAHHIFGGGNRWDILPARPRLGAPQEPQCAAGGGDMGEAQERGVRPGLDEKLPGLRPDRED